MVDGYKVGKCCGNSIMRKIIATACLFFCSVCFGQTFQVGTLQVQSTTNASNPSTGAATIVGGLGVGSNIYAGGSIFGAVQASSLSASGTISGTGFANLLAPYAPIANPTFTGTPAAPTATFGVNTTQLATTAYTLASGLHYPSSGSQTWNTNTSISSSQVNNAGVFTASSVTVTLPTQSTVVAGSTYTFVGGGFGGTISPQSTDQICFSWSGCLGTGTSFSIGGGDVITLTAISGTSKWQITSIGRSANADQCTSIGQFGADPTGVSDTTGPLNRAIAFATVYASVTHQGLCISLPAGKFSFSGTYQYTFPSTVQSGITIRGAGSEATTLVFGSSGHGLQINLASNANTVHLRDFTVVTTVANSTGAGIFVINPVPTITVTDQMNSDVTNVTVRGSDGPGGSIDYWEYGVLIENVSNVNLTGISVQGISAHNVGTGIAIAQNCSSCGYFPVQFNITGSQLSELSNGFLYGGSVQGVTINQSNFTNDNFGIIIPSSETGLDQLTVTNSQFNCFNAGINMQTGVIQTMISNNLFLIRTSASGISFSSYLNNTVTGNSFGNAGSATSTTGISFTTNVSQNSVVTGNSFAQLTTGINLITGSTNVNVQSNAYSSNTNNVVNNCSSGCTVGGGSQ